MTRTSDTVRTHLQRCRTLGEGLLKLCAHQSPYTGRTHRLFPPPQAASVRPRFEPTATPPSRATSRGCYRYANPHTRTPPFLFVRTYVYTRTRVDMEGKPQLTQPCFSLCPFEKDGSSVAQDIILMQGERVRAHIYALWTLKVWNKCAQYALRTCIQYTL